ncbi:transporter [Castellaniella sp.]|uniref:SphA family protein n=1 Tax=Castellaniella sp. TaxID=1955812 RepID=UPI00355CE801
MKKRSRLGMLAINAALSLMATQAWASENGTSFYLLGSKGPMAGVVPAPGLYLQNDLYYYTARADESQALPTGGQVAVGLKAKALINLPTLIWSTPYTLLDGRLALGVTLPFGYQEIDAGLVLGPYAGNTSSRTTTMGDPVLTGILGWDNGPFHWNVTTMINVPAGHYRQDSMANIAFHRWGADVSVAGTWYDPAVGWDISGVLGVTFNGNNPKTNYRSGTEWHLEAGVSRDIGGPGSTLGVIGYYHQQITDDSGDGAVLGGFRGRTAALGVTASHAFKLGNTPMLARVKVLREFDTRNRVEGTAAYLTFSLPFQ